jgi:chemotaxis protein methyltransferase CheR
MNDETCVHFLQWCLPQLGKQWAGFRKVRSQVCKRIARRMHDLNLASTEVYRDYLNAHPSEWDRLDAMCRITISRFYRDRGVYDALRAPLLPNSAHQLGAEGTLRVWCAGCASGEEPYTLRLLWDLDVSDRVPNGVTFHITATDAQAHMLARARRGCYPHGTLKDLPDAWIKTAFTLRDSSFDDPCCIQAAYRHGIDWLQQDIRHTMPDGPFDLILCRNLVFTYFDADLQHTCLDRMVDRLAAGGLLVVGNHETLPPGNWPLDALDSYPQMYRKSACR